MIVKELKLVVMYKKSYSELTLKVNKTNVYMKEQFKSKTPFKTFKFEIAT